MPFVVDLKENPKCRGIEYIVECDIHDGMVWGMFSGFGRVVGSENNLFASFS